MGKVQLIHVGVSQIVGGSEFGLLVLSDMSESRQIAIVCDEHMEYQFGLRTDEKINTERLLPEVLCSINPSITSEHYEILFNSVLNGQYKALLVNKDDLSLTPMRASDAILLAHIAKLNLFMEEYLFNRQSVPCGPSKNRLAVPINTLTLEMLKKALDKAIEEENYELASMLRDELNQRDKSKNEG